MTVETWMEQREQPGTPANTARVILERDETYRTFEKTLRSMYVLEVLMRHGGNQQEAAKAIGVATNTINRAIRSMRLRSKDVKAIADRIARRTA